MIDVEAEVYSPIAKALRTAYPGIYVTSEADERIPAKLPCVQIVETDNYQPPARLDSGPERFAEITYTVTVWTNRVAGKKALNREILGFVDAMLFEKDFVRESITPQTTIGNGSIYWMAARYLAAVDGEHFYRRQ